MEAMLENAEAKAVLAEARHVFVGVRGKHAPHVTPDSFAVSNGRIWLVTSTRSLKARRMRRHPDVGLLFRAGDRSLVVSGRAEILSLRSFDEAMRLTTNAIPALTSVLRYSARNVQGMLGYVLDLCRMPAGSSPTDRVLVSIRPTGGVLVHGGDVERTWGFRATRPTRTPTRRAHDTQPFAMPAGLPIEVVDLLDHPRDAAVGWMTRRGPIVVPGTWDPGLRVALVGSRVLDAVGAPEDANACVTLDDSASIRPTGFRGVILQGHAEAHRVNGRARVDLDAERASWWRGFQTGSLGLSRTARARRVPA